jgi:hypothetical protein
MGRSAFLFWANLPGMMMAIFSVMSVHSHVDAVTRLRLEYLLLTNLVSGHPHNRFSEESACTQLRAGGASYIHLHISEQPAARRNQIALPLTLEWAVGAT